MPDDLQLLLTADGSYTLSHPGRPESYHSRHGAVTESKSVFLQNSGVLRRLQSNQATAVLEIGFGSGLNFAVTAAAAKEHKCKLHYAAYDYAPPPPTLVRELLTLNTSDFNAEIECLVTALSSNTPSVQQIDRYTDLEFIKQDVRQADLAPSQFHVVYLDAFSIKQNPDLWTKQFLLKLYKTLKPGGLLTSYSVNRAFKDALQGAGFTWRKVPGPGGKREVIIACRQST